MDSFGSVSTGADREHDVDGASNTVGVTYFGEPRAQLRRSEADFYISHPDRCESPTTRSSGPLHLNQPASNTAALAQRTCSLTLKAFALRACEQGLHMRYARCVDLLDDLHAGLADGTYARRLKGWARPALLIIDDVGLGQVKRRAEEPTAAHTLYNLVDRRHGHASTAVTSNIGLSDWGRYLGDATLTAAILDRLAMHAIRIDIPGPSWRQHIAKTRAAERSPST